MQTESKTFEQIENEVFIALMAEVPDLQPLVARGLARTAAINFAQHHIAGLTPATQNENDQQKF